MSEPASKRPLPPLKPYRVYLRYLVTVDVEAESQQAAVDAALEEMDQTGEWETTDCQVDPLDAPGGWPMDTQETEGGRA